MGLGLALAIAVGMALNASLLALAASLGALAISLVSPLVGVVVVTFTAPFPRPVVLPTPGLQVALLGAIMLGLVLRLPLDRPKLTMPAPSVLMLGAFMLYAGMHLLGGLIDGPASGRSYQIVQVYSQLLTGALAFVAVSIALRGRSPYAVLVVSLTAALLAAGLGLLDAQGTHQLGRLMEPPPTDYGRITGPALDPNYYGSYLAAMITLSVALVAVARSAKVKAALVATAVFVGLALVLTQSRGAFLAVAAGMLTAAFTRGRRVGLLAVVALAVAVMVGYPIFLAWRFGSGVDGGITTVAETSGRLDTALPGLAMFAKSPLFGVGLGRYIEESPIGLSSHNWYITVLAEMGIVGVVLWVLFLGSLAIGLRGTSSSARTVGYSVMATWMIASVTLDVPAAYQVTGPVLIVLALALVARWPDRPPPLPSLRPIRARGGNVLLHEGRV